MDGIFDALREGALTLQSGGGIGYDFSTLRPAGFAAERSGTLASGPVSFMRVWDSMCATLVSTGARRGAMMATLRCDHPDIETFVEAKREPGQLRHFNLSVQVDDAFMRAVAADGPWPLVFPDPQQQRRGAAQSVVRDWPGHRDPVACAVVRTISARALWERIMRAAYEAAEPGVLFIDRINRLNNLHYRERIGATNPCGEVPLPPYGSCDLGSINLVRFVRAPFTAQAALDLEGIDATARVAVRFLDDVIDASRFPLPRQAETARATRRIGLGVTGLADALAMLGLHYASPQARQAAAGILERLCHTAYRSSVELAREKGAFPAFEAAPYLAGEFVGRLPPDIREAIARHGIRNSHLLAIAPTGTISLLAGNVSGGIEPVFDLAYERRVRQADGRREAFRVEDYAWALWRGQGGGDPSQTFVTAAELPPEAHLAMQASLQPYVDNAISKTVNVPRDYPFEAFRDIYRQAFELGLKGVTVFRPNPVTGEVLVADSSQRCCTLPETSGVLAGPAQA